MEANEVHPQANWTPWHTLYMRTRCGRDWRVTQVFRGPDGGAFRIEGYRTEEHGMVRISAVPWDIVKVARGPGCAHWITSHRALARKVRSGCDCAFCVNMPNQVPA